METWSNRKHNDAGQLTRKTYHNLLGHHWRIQSGRRRFGRRC